MSPVLLILTIADLVHPIISTRLLPKDNSIIHCAGQSNDAFKKYTKYLNDNTEPAVQMYYMGLDKSTSDIQDYFNGVKSTIDKYPSSQWVGIQLGLDFSGHSQDIAKGEYTDKINALIEGMKSVEHPFWIRLGYEFNGQWNDYGPKDDYIKSFQIITDALRNNSWTNKNVANVWDFSADAKDLDYNSWYPGDKYVDWYGINIFSGDSAPQSSTVINFIENACKKGYPVLFGESTPRGTPVTQGEECWNKWFQPYFYERILSTDSAKDCVKGFCYINWNWTDTSQWPTWGDAQIEDNEYVGSHYQEALYKGKYLHGTNKSHMLSVLGIN